MVSGPEDPSFKTSKNTNVMLPVDGKSLQFVISYFTAAPFFLHKIGWSSLAGVIDEPDLIPQKLGLVAPMKSKS